MNISSINNTTSISATANKSSAYLDVIKQNQNETNVSNNVTISEAGRTAAKYDMEGGRSNYPPLEMFQIAAWRLDYFTGPMLGEGVNTKYPEIMVGKEIAKIPYENRDEYSKIVNSNYSENLKNFDINSVEEHYEALIVDKDQSEMIRKSFKAMMDNDPRVIAMLNT